MAVSAKTEFDVDAPASLIMEILLDIDSLPQWSDAHKSAEVLSTHPDGTPDRVHIVAGLSGISDEQTLAYTWTENSCTWDLVEGKQLSQQHGVYRLTPDGDKTHVEFELEVDLKIKLPGLIVKRGQKAAVETAKKGLIAEAKRRSAA
ncbi:cyclase [Gordonia amarae]|uniref:Coenzyme Q-binding protein COQ10 START domain-containing protein n=2 Tax=Gordonia amarae TaxID=36821 RepID=G7GND1_9ACTN|nr:SRPBCC family protein [Gordonia amarae]MCS3877112.1 putative membrane protein [Gordonia amarae]QHN15908.1 cyclase [Gordonia amarae]QHN20476.1 cyclase [Gordonia amarae]QHN29328.1 cyclase [Gordonia amarae]QHN38107.1 cyclase [Gordonia amarae]